MSKEIIEFIYATLLIHDFVFVVALLIFMELSEKK